MWFEEIKEKLLKEDDEFRRIAEEHRQYDEELNQLAQRKYHSPEDTLHEVELKKKKLAVKDRMLEIATRYRQTPPA